MKKTVDFTRLAAKMALDEAMTIDEAIQELKSEIEWSKLNRYPYVGQRKVKAINMVIKALEQKSNDDVNKSIWIVTYWNKEIEPVVTAFDNKEAAQTCCDYFSKEYSCCVDECDIYSSFTHKIDEIKADNIFEK